MSNKCVEVEQCSDPDLVAAKFASHFCSAYTANNADTAEALYNQYVAARSGYCGFYPRDAMLARVIAITTCLSVCHAPVLCQNEES